jgi:hypothetical protein
MAFLNEIWTPRHNAGLRSQFGMRGPAPAKQLAPEIAPTVEIESVHQSPTLQRGHGWHTFLIGQFLNAVAAQFSSIWFGVNNRDIIVEVLAFIISAPSSGVRLIHTPDPVLTSILKGRDSDSRDPTFAQVTAPYPLLVEAQNTVAGVGGVNQESTSAAVVVRTRCRCSTR